jgi:hypothetical protein
MGDQELGDDVILLPLAGVAEEYEHHYGRDNAPDEDHGVTGLDPQDHGQHDDHEGDDGEHGVPLRLALHGLLLLGLNYLPALARWNDPYLRFVGVLGVVIGDDVLQLPLGQVLGHRAREHGLSRTRLAYEHHMPLLLGRLLDDHDSLVLTDDLIG